MRMSLSFRECGRSQWNSFWVVGFSATNVQSVALKEPRLGSLLLSWEAPWLGISKPANGAPPESQWSSVCGGGDTFRRAVYAAWSPREPWRYIDATKLLLPFYYMADCRCFRNTVADNIFTCAVNMVAFSGDSWGCFGAVGWRFSREP